MIFSDGQSLRPVASRFSLAFQPTIQNSKPKQEVPFHPTLFAPLHSDITHALPNAVSGMSVHLWRPKATKATPPFSGSGKKKGSFAHDLVLAAGSFHSFNRSLRRSYLSTTLTNSFCSSHQLQHRMCEYFVPQHPHFPRPTITAFPLIFTCDIVCPTKPGPSYSHLKRPVQIVSSCY